MPFLLNILWPAEILVVTLKHLGRGCTGQHLLARCCLGSGFGHHLLKHYSFCFIPGWKGAENIQWPGCHWWLDLPQEERMQWQVWATQVWWHITSRMASSLKMLFSCLIPEVLYLEELAETCSLLCRSGNFQQVWNQDIICCVVHGSQHLSL